MAQYGAVLFPDFHRFHQLIVSYFRLGEPEDCAGTVSFLASHDSSYITGETIVMSGGMLSRL